MRNNLNLSTDVCYNDPEPSKEWMSARILVKAQT